MKRLIKPPAAAPSAALLLGYTGLIPFVGLALASTLIDATWLMSWFCLSSAVILSFLGGIRWGVYAAQAKPQQRDVLISIVVSLWAFGALLLPAPEQQLGALLLGHLLTAAVDGLRPPTGQAGWLRPLRLQLSAVAAVCHGVFLLT